MTSGREDSQTKRQKPRLKIWLKAILVVLIVIAFAFASYFLIQHSNLFNIRDINLEKIRDEQLGIDSNAPDNSGSSNCQAAPEDPRFLTIESAGVNQACIVPIGVLTPDDSGSQQLDAPKSYYDIGWYNCQMNPIAENRCASPTRPGDDNTATAAIMDGHSCTGSNCIFDRLTDVKNGDKIIVERGDGEKFTYAVKEVSVVKLADVDMAKMMRPIIHDQEGLNLITCAGNWTARDARGVVTMDQRVMVFATRSS